MEFDTLNDPLRYFSSFKPEHGVVARLVLKATPELTDETSWTPVLTVPVVEGSQNRVTEPLAGPAKFYRLRK